MKSLIAVLLAICFATPGLYAQEEADSIAKLQADFQDAGAEDDRIDAEEMKSFGKRALAMAKNKGGSRFQRLYLGILRLPSG